MENKWKEIVEKLKGQKGIPGKNQLLIIFLAGLLLVVIAIPASDKKGGGTEREDTSVQDGLSSYSSQNSSGEYEEYMERRVAEALECVEGVGKAEVMITLKSSGQKIVEKDQQSSSQVSQEEDSSGGTRTVEDQTADKTSIYEQTSDGSQSPYVSKEMAPEIAGVLVIAQGGDDAVVVQNITEAIQALFGVEAHKIKIMKRTDT
ncbi:stage III sporulation protein AG [Luxibacter massiliensis]|uniref:stage III sporulation protein AG n=1 Tax=Luxibacter massiliensis TaxID=2219695 RepID=UPI000F0663C8|nr:stage III sporulation protein AG [Luxibacter massiliensis]